MTRNRGDDPFELYQEKFVEILNRFHEEISLSQDLTPTDEFFDTIPDKTNLIKFDNKRRKKKKDKAHEGSSGRAIEDT